jgi:hypothetical protein
MTKHLKNTLAAIALTILTTGAAHANTHVSASNAPAWLPGIDLRQVAVRGSGPEADPYFQHHPAMKQAAAKQWLAGVDLRLVAVRAPSPEAGPHLQHAPAR